MCVSSMVVFELCSDWGDSYKFRDACGASEALYSQTASSTTLQCKHVQLSIANLQLSTLDLTPTMAPLGGPRHFFLTRLQVNSVQSHARNKRTADSCISPIAFHIIRCAIVLYFLPSLSPAGRDLEDKS